MFYPRPLGKKKNYKLKKVVKVKKVAKAPRVPSTVKAYVKKQIAIRQEDKHADPYVINKIKLEPFEFAGGIANPQTGTMFEFTSVFSNIHRGTGQGDRIGNIIHPKYCNAKGYLSVPDFKTITGNSADYFQSQRFVKMVLFRQRRTLNPPVAVDGIFQSGNTVNGPDNNLNDIINKFNNDDFQILTTRVFKLGSSVQGVPNNDFKQSSFFNINLLPYLPKRIRYSDPEDDSPPTNCAIYAMFLHSFANGIDMNVTGPVDFVIPETNISFQVNCSYEDS